ncbi:MAG: hypothetical protein KAS16_05845 [Thermoplasmata archaeon]|nr:hypothetical protein [Thermoplasmata archaeon]
MENKGRFMPYGHVKSQYPLWSTRDLSWAIKDQMKMVIILVGMLLAIVDVFLYFKFELASEFWIYTIIVFILLILCMIPLWKYTKNWVKGMEGTYHLRAKCDDDGFNMLIQTITQILDDAETECRIEPDNFQAKLGQAWIPEKNVMTFTGFVKIAHITYDITVEEGLDIHLNSLAMYPGMEGKFITGLDRHFSVSVDDVITVRS